MNWAYGVTTVPSRSGDLLPKTLRSLAAAGFDKPRLFVDGLPDQELTPWFHSFGGLEITNHFPKVKTAANWTLALAELYSRHPTFERFAVFQDDLIAVRNLRPYLDSIPYPCKDPPRNKNKEILGYWNLYTFPHNQELAAGRKGFFESNQRGRGAVALVFDRHACLTVLGSRHIWDRAADSKRGDQCIDGGAVTAISLADGKEYCHNPSLVQHTGLVSTMGNRPHPQAPSFPGEHFDAMELLHG